MLKYLLRQGAKPADLPKVYYCSCAEDMERHFEKITSEILQLKNCVIWYRDDRKEAVEAELLQEMELVIIPVTYTLLSGKDEMFEREYTFFTERHIAILPILCESGLEPLYEKKFGSIQYLSRISADITEISYSEKLKKRLEGVLSDDETIVRIKNNFDGRIFVSYRKKDRAYARRLMTLIHDNEKLMGYATWYDEFLIPGENFNHSIMDELKKSDIFSLVVTPGVLEDNNYIITDEYPAAVELGKDVIPFELVATDGSALLEKFPGIPPCVDAYKQDDIQKAFIYYIPDLNYKQTWLADDVKNAERNYLLGLAYLTGTDVETNKPKGAELIMRAAKYLYEAKEKMVSIYQSGDGVAADVHKAAEYLRELIPFYKQRYEENPTDENAQIWIESIMKSTEILDRNLQYEKKIVWKYRDIAEYFKKENEHSFSSAAMAGVMLAYVKATEFQLVRNGGKHTNEALWYYRDNCEKGDSSFVQKALAKVYATDADYELHYNFANAGRRAPRGFWDDFPTMEEINLELLVDYYNAIRSITAPYDSAYNIVAKLIENEDSEALRIELAQINVKKCKALFSLGAFAEAEEKAKSSVYVISSADSYGESAILAEAYETVAFSCMLQGKHEEALEFYDKAYNIFFKLAERTKLPHDYSRAYYNAYILLCVALLCRADGYENVLENAIRIYDDWLGVARSEMDVIYDVLCRMKKFGFGMDKNISDTEYMNGVLQNIIGANGYFLQERAHYFIDRFARRIETCYVIFTLSIKLSALCRDDEELYKYYSTKAAKAFNYLAEYGIVSFNMLIEKGVSPQMFGGFSSVYEFAEKAAKELKESKTESKRKEIMEKYADLNKRRIALSDKFEKYYEIKTAICEIEHDSRTNERDSRTIKQLFETFKKISDEKIDGLESIQAAMIIEIESYQAKIESNLARMHSCVDEIKRKKEEIGEEWHEMIRIDGDRRRYIYEMVSNYLSDLDVTADLNEIAEITGEEEDYIARMLKPYAYIENGKTVYKGKYNPEQMKSSEYLEVKAFLDDYFTDKDEEDEDEIYGFFDTFNEPYLTFVLVKKDGYKSEYDFENRKSKIKKVKTNEENS